MATISVLLLLSFRGFLAAARVLRRSSKLVATESSRNVVLFMVVLLFFVVFLLSVVPDYDALYAVLSPVSPVPRTAKVFARFRRQKLFVMCILVRRVT